MVEKAVSWWKADQLVALLPSFCSVRRLQCVNFVCGEEVGGGGGACVLCAHFNTARPFQTCFHWACVHSCDRSDALQVTRQPASKFHMHPSIASFLAFFTCSLANYYALKLSFTNESVAAVTLVSVHVSVTISKFDDSKSLSRC